VTDMVVAGVLLDLAIKAEALANSALRYIDNAMSVEIWGVKGYTSADPFRATIHTEERYSIRLVWTRCIQPLLRHLPDGSEAGMSAHAHAKTKAQ
jgi:hypothetical protein